MSRAQAIAAQITGLPLDKVIVHNHLLGGGFGRRLEVDQVGTAVRIAQHVDAPVKVVWTREEDIRHDVYRPAWHDRMSARLDGGKIVAWKHVFAGSSVLARWLPAAFVDGKDFDAVDCAADMPYDIPELSRGPCPRGAAGRDDRLLARRRAVAQRLRRRKLHRRARAQGGRRSGPVPAEHAGQGAAPAGRAEARRAEIGLGNAASPRRRPRRRRAAGLCQLDRHGGGGRRWTAMAR